MNFFKNRFNKIVRQINGAERKAAARPERREGASHAPERLVSAGGVYGLLAGGERQAYRSY